MPSSSQCGRSRPLPHTKGLSKFSLNFLASLHLILRRVEELVFITKKKDLQFQEEGNESARGM